MAADPKPKPDPWRLNEEARRRQVLEGAKRPLAVNLAEASLCVVLESLARESSRRAGETLAVPPAPAALRVEPV